MSAIGIRRRCAIWLACWRLRRKQVRPNWLTACAGVSNATRRMRLLGQPDAAHAAFADRLQQPELPDRDRTALFLGEWLFGSMALGILHGTLIHQTPYNEDIAWQHWQQAAPAA